MYDDNDMHAQKYIFMYTHTSSSLCISSTHFYTLLIINNKSKYNNDADIDDDNRF